MFKNHFLAFGVVLVLASSAVFSQGQQSLIITPTTFDFGWCPDNAKISAEFTLKNSGVDMIPITSVQPTCGCTASNFTPGALASNEETKVGLTFNTRGYAGTEFHKSAKVKTDGIEAEYTVQLTGHVLNSNAKVVPDSDGIAGFDVGTKEKKKTIHIQNKSDKDVTIEMVLKPAAWAKVKIDSPVIKAGQSTSMDVSVDGSVDENRETSITLAANDGAVVSRLTVAIRTGTPPAPMKRPAAPAPAAPTPAKVEPAKVVPH